MRTIKFRGKVDGYWWYAEYNPDQIFGNWEQFWALVDKETVGEYVGSPGRDGKEIYEGDILGVDDDPEDNSKALVIFHQGAFQLQLPIHHKPIYDHDWNWVVIGNIHDNPELMLVKKG